jgi:protein SCO1
MRRALSAAVLACFWATAPASAQRYPVTALILSIDQAHRTFIASSSAIAGYMKAMVMPFTVRDTGMLKGLKPSLFVDFTLAVENGHSYAENVRVREYGSLEQEPLLVRRLQLLARPDKRNAQTPSIDIGQRVPDFTLTDQTGRRVTLSRFAGKVVGVTFIYTSCPLPDYCFGPSNNFGRLQKRFGDRMGRDLVLLCISFDPVHDQPAVLAGYASIWKADPNSWHFLTGTLPEVKKVCRRFGLNFWPDEANLSHSLHTVVIDRRGKLAADFEGNQFTAEQLGDFVEMKMNERR